MKLFFFIYLAFFSNFCFTQRFLIKDYETKLGIPYVAVYSPQTNIGIYSNDKGFFELLDKKNDSIYISSLGYQTKKIKTSQLQDITYLIPNSIMLDELILKSTISKKRKVGFRSQNNYWFAARSLELGLLIKPNDKNNNSIISKIIIPVKKKLPGSKQKNKTIFSSVMKLGIFSVKNNQPYQEITKNPIIIEFNNESSELIVVDLLNELIKFSNEGLFFNLTLLGEVNEEGNVTNVDYPLPGLVCTTKKSKDFSYVKAFYKLKFSNDWNKLSYKDLLMDKPTYPALKFVLKVYD